MTERTVETVKKLFGRGTGLSYLLIQEAAILMAFIVGAAVLTVTGYSAVDAYTTMGKGAFGSVYGVGQTLTQATPIIFTSLAFLVAFKAGLFNIGAEGQFLMNRLQSRRRASPNVTSNRWRRIASRSISHNRSSSVTR